MNFWLIHHIVSFWTQGTFKTFMSHKADQCHSNCRYYPDWYLLNYLHSFYLDSIFNFKVWFTNLKALTRNYWLSLSLCSASITFQIWIASYLLTCEVALCGSTACIALIKDLYGVSRLKLSLQGSLGWIFLRFCQDSFSK